MKPQIYINCVVIVCLIAAIYFLTTEPPSSTPFILALIPLLVVRYKYRVDSKKILNELIQKPAT